MKIIYPEEVIAISSDYNQKENPINYYNMKYMRNMFR